MVTAKDIPSTASAEASDIETIPAIPDIAVPPGDLYSDEPTLETDLHLRQMLLLITSLEWLWQDRNDFFATGNLTIYFSPKQIKNQDFRGPDFFVVLDTERRSRKSWVVWEEDGKYPNVIIEVLSDSTAKADRTTKKQIYQDTFRTPEYFWIDPDTLEFAGFVLMAGEYQPIAPNDAGQLWSRQLDLYLGIRESKLRLFTPDGELVPTPTEAAKIAQQETEEVQQQAEQAQQQAEQAQQQAEQAQEKANRLAARLRELGVDPDTV
ncbi:Uma2 family endonuclease [Oscillatoria sp. CS-180]|uniref:Uma2 family endonuclease n=1 Tax=Oscillatoria sp. CS-180 TaxID=3021720 RepID=UPI00232B810F|nr:Uma2 family endonuclease [Oscillatoria sp. CS-180]MDB9525775.1 Uma2 family endonuclease [Oscillatoria sp. CS-180]